MYKNILHLITLTSILSFSLGSTAQNATCDYTWCDYLKTDIPGSELENQYGAGLDGHPLPVPNPVTGKTIVIDNSAGDDRVSIQNAIDNASFGDEIYLPNGVYELKSFNASYTRPDSDYVDGVSAKARDYDEGAILLRSGINIRGESEDGVVLKFDPSSGAEGALCALGKHWSVINVYIKNLTITTSSGYMTYPVRLWNTEYGSGVVNNIVLESITVENFDRRGFRLETVEDILLLKCTAQKTNEPSNGYGFEVFGDNDFGAYETRYITFQFCQALGPNMRHGFIVQDKAHHILIDRCYAYQNYYGAIELHANGEHHVEIRNCVVEEPRSIAIKIRSGAGDSNWVHHNTIIKADEGKEIVEETSPNQIEYNCILPDIPTGLAVSGQPVRLQLYPNPANNETFLTVAPEMLAARITIKIHNHLGEIVRSVDPGPQSERIRLDLSPCAPGIYFITVEYSGNRLVKKLVKF